MKKFLFYLLIVVSLPGCTAGSKATGNAKLPKPYDYWFFNFAYPKALPAWVTYVEMLDREGYYYQFRMLDGTQPRSDSVGRWNEPVGAGSSSLNKVNDPPRFIHFCWDSVIDKKVYETEIAFNSRIDSMMLTPVPNVEKKLYYRYMVIGLAPEGKVRVWLENVFNDYIRLSDLPARDFKIKTVSGSQLKMCKGVTYFGDGYEYIDETINFIKGKKYPYGEW